jgi:hypothetical protein
VADYPIYKADNDPWSIDFFYHHLSYVNVTGDPWSNNITSGLVDGVANLNIQYCLAEPVDRVCHVGLSSTLLLAVAICVFAKTATAILVTVVLTRQNQQPLVTLGDAIESFIRQPDPNTLGMCTVGQTEARQGMKTARKILLGGPKNWQATQQRRWTVVPKTVWLTSYTMFFLSIALVSYFFVVSYNKTGL